MVKLIVHADDFGLDEEINNGIEKAHTQGILTSASIMPNGNSFGHAVSIAKSLPELDIGIHLTLVEETPLSDRKLISSIIDEEGNFYPHTSSFFTRYLMGKIDPAQVYRELDLQIQKVFDTGLPISHLDSHQHTHIIPGVFKEVVKLASKYKINAIRIPKEKIRLYMLYPGNLLRVFELGMVNFMCGLNKNKNLIKTDYFAGFYFGGQLGKSNLLKVLTTVSQPGIHELMCHPGNIPLHNEYSHWNYLWYDELSALTDPAIQEFITQKGISLISYRDISNVTMHH